MPQIVNKALDRLADAILARKKTTEKAQPRTKPDQKRSAVIKRRDRFGFGRLGSRWTRVTATSLLLVGGALPALADSGDTTRVSVNEYGGEAAGHSDSSAASVDGRYVAFQSTAFNLVEGDLNGVADVFVHDRQTGDTSRVSVDSMGGEGNGLSRSPAISADGRYVSFVSDATNLVDVDTNNTGDVFVHDRQTGTTTRVSVGSGGGESNGPSYSPAISANGRHVSFVSYATNLVESDYNNALDVFVHDRQTGATSRVSVDSTGNQGDGISQAPAISANGRYVAFTSLASNLVANDANGVGDVFVHDRQTGQTSLISVDSNGIQGNGASRAPAISGDGRYVAFASSAANMVGGDGNGSGDVFVHDSETGSTTRVSVKSDGGEGSGGSYEPAISGDGRHVAFSSDASDLVEADNNGTTDVFAHDRETGRTVRVSVSTSGGEGNDYSEIPSISANGRLVLFESMATNLVPSDGNGALDVFAHEIEVDDTAPTTPAPPPTPPTSPPSGDDWFVDDNGSTFEKDINAVAAAGITRGCNPPANDRFCPDDGVTRGQMAAFLTRAFGLAVPAANPFGDTAGHTFQRDIQALAQAGITRGCNPPANDRFCPDDFVTRGQMAAFLNRAFLSP